MLAEMSLLARDRALPDADPERSREHTIGRTWFPSFGLDFGPSDARLHDKTNPTSHVAVDGVV